MFREIVRHAQGAKLIHFFYFFSENKLSFSGYSAAINIRSIYFVDI